MDRLLPLAGEIATRLKARGESVAVAESSTGGLVSAALLSVPGASAYFRGGGVIYTARARWSLLDVTKENMAVVERASTEPYARLLAARVKHKLGSDWALGETGATGPTGNRYGDAAGHTCVAVDGLVSFCRTVETGLDDRSENMRLFGLALLEGFLESLEKA